MVEECFGVYLIIVHTLVHLVEAVDGIILVDTENLLDDIILDGAED